MITRDDIVITSKHSPCYTATKYKATAELSCSMMFSNEELRSAIFDMDSRAREELKRGILSQIYGDILTDLYALKHLVYSSAYIRSSSVADNLDAKFNDLINSIPQ